MTTKIWKRFKIEFSVYVGIGGVAVSLVSAINVFYFQKLLDALWSKHAYSKSSDLWIDNYLRSNIFLSRTKA